MTQDSTDNGWTNYATWRVNLEFCDSLLQGMLEEGTFEVIQDASTARADLADYLAEACEEFVTADDYHQEKPATQYAVAFLGQVSWWEIADSFLADNPDVLPTDDSGPQKVCDDCGGVITEEQADAEDFIGYCPTCAARNE